MMQALKAQSGFSLLELVIASAIIATSGAAILGIFSSITSLNGRSRNLAIVTQLAQKKIEAYRNTDYNNITLGTEDFSSSLPPNLGAPKTATAAVTEPEAGLKRVDLAISYKESTTDKKIELSTYITQRGLNR